VVGASLCISEGKPDPDDELFKEMLFLDQEFQLLQAIITRIK
jgi:hypothetical protein